MTLIFNEAIERSTNSIQELIRLADSDDAQRLLNFVLGELANVKQRFKEISTGSKDLNIPFEKEFFNLESEFSKQKMVWNQTIEDVTKASDRKIEQYIKEIEAEREAHQKTYDNLIEANKKIHHIEQQQREIEELTLRMTDKDRRLDNQNHDLNTTTTKLRDAESELVRLREEAPRLKNRLDAIAKDYDDTRNLVDSLREDKRTLEEDIRRFQEDARQAKDDNRELKRELQDIVSQKKKDIDYLEREL